MAAAADDDDFFGGQSSETWGFEADKRKHTADAQTVSWSVRGPAVASLGGMQSSFREAAAEASDEAMQVGFEVGFDTVRPEEFLRGFLAGSLRSAALSADAALAERCEALAKRITLNDRETRVDDGVDLALRGIATEASDEGVRKWTARERAAWVLQELDRMAAGALPALSAECNSLLGEALGRPVDAWEHACKLLRDRAQSEL
jgi:hypothetical protein